MRRQQEATTRSTFSSGILTLGLISIIPTWVLGLEQLIPPAILILGFLLLLLTGHRIRVPVTAWVFLLFIALSLLSAIALSGGRALVLFVRGHAVYVSGLVALVLAAEAGSTKVGLERLLKSFLIFGLFVGVVVVGFAVGWLPATFEVPFKGLFGDILVSSEYFREHILVRRIAVWQEPLPDIWVSRASSVFLYSTLLAAAVLPIITFSSLSAYALKRRWKLVAGASIALAFVCLWESRGRSASLLAFLLLAGIAAWVVVGRRWGWILLLATAVLLVVGVSAILLSPIDGSPVWKTQFIEYRPDSLINRLEIYKQSAQQISERPVLGWGVTEMVDRSLGSRAQLAPHLRLGTHSELLNVAYRFGLLGLVLYLGVGGVFFAWYVHRLRGVTGVDSSRQARDLLVILGLGAVVIAINSLLHMPNWDVNVYWISWCVPGLAHGVGRWGQRSTPQALAHLA